MSLALLPAPTPSRSLPFVLAPVRPSHFFFFFSSLHLASTLLLNLRRVRPTPPLKDENSSTRMTCACAHPPPHTLHPYATTYAHLAGARVCGCARQRENKKQDSFLTRTKDYHRHRHRYRYTRPLACDFLHVIVEGHTARVLMSFSQLVELILPCGGARTRSLLSHTLFCNDAQFTTDCSTENRRGICREFVTPVDCMHNQRSRTHVSMYPLHTQSHASALLDDLMILPALIMSS